MGTDNKANAVLETGAFRSYYKTGSASQFHMSKDRVLID
jgi:hypothetical protein